MKPYRRDATHGPIVQDIEGAGGRVWDLTPYRSPVDLVVLFGDEVFLVDAKSAAGAPRTKTQDKMVADGWPIVFGVTGQEVLDGIFALRRGRGGRPAALTGGPQCHT